MPELRRWASSAMPTWWASTRVRARVGSSRPGRTAPTSTSGTRHRQPRTAAPSPPGVVVVDVSDPTHPTPTHLADSQLDDRPLGVREGESGPAACSGVHRQPRRRDGFSVYDITADCTAPVLKSDVHLPGSFGHTGQWAPDGKTYYVTPLRATPSIIAVDVTSRPPPLRNPRRTLYFPRSRPRAPGPQSRQVAVARPRVHKDGNTAYITMFGVGSNNGFAILDVSDFQQRRANPMYRVIGQLPGTTEASGRRTRSPITIAGKPYILVTDEGGAWLAGVCASMASRQRVPQTHRHQRPTHPTVAAKIQLDVVQTRRTAPHATAPIVSTQLCRTAGRGRPNPPFFAHSCHYCNVDDVDDAKIAACNCFASGLRFFDIHDVTNSRRWPTTSLRPKERSPSRPRCTRTATPPPPTCDSTTGRPPSPASRRTVNADAVETSGRRPRTTGSWSSPCTRR